MQCSSCQQITAVILMVVVVAGPSSGRLKCQPHTAVQLLSMRSCLCLWAVCHTVSGASVTCTSYKPTSLVWCVGALMEHMHIRRSKTRSAVQLWCETWTHETSYGTPDAHSMSGKVLNLTAHCMHTSLPCRHSVVGRMLNTLLAPQRQHNNPCRGSCCTSQRSTILRSCEATSSGANASPTSVQRCFT